MKINNIGTVVAERELEGWVDGNPCRIVVRFGKPVRDESDGAWYCPYTIVSPRGERLFYGAGLDSLQALKIAISNAGTELTTLYCDLTLKWAGESDLGFLS